jgi:hypothetical protein
MARWAPLDLLGKQVRQENQERQVKLVLMEVMEPTEPLVFRDLPALWVLLVLWAL